MVSLNKPMKIAIIALFSFLSSVRSTELITPGTYLLCSAMDVESVEKIEITYLPDSSYVETVYNFAYLSNMQRYGKWYQKQDTLFHTVSKMCFQTQTTLPCTTYTPPYSSYYYFVGNNLDTTFYFESGYLRAMHITDAKAYFKQQKYRDIHLMGIIPKRKPNSQVKAKK